MDDTKKTTTKVWITYGLVGFLLGACLVSLSAVGLVAYETANPPPTQTPLPTPTIAAEAILNEANQNLYENPLQVLEMLEPHLEEFTDTNDLARALWYMGSAEMQLGHNQLATVYFERLIQVSPTPENYMTLARIYDAAGDLEKAVGYYIIYLNSDDTLLTEDLRIMLQERVDQIQLILTDPSLTPIPSTAAQAILTEAFQMLYEDPQQVLDILEPHLEEFTDPDDLATALQYMGLAELSLEHYQIATVYFERLIQISPTPENYATLARIYDASGDLEKAIEYYVIYLNSDDPVLTEDMRAILQERIDQIQLILMNPTPTVIP